MKIIRWILNYCFIMWVVFLVAGVWAIMDYVLLGKIQPITKWMVKAAWRYNYVD